MKITSIRPVLLSAAYGRAEDTELRQAYPTGKRSAAFAVIETDEGVTGLGETYSGVFAPELAAQLITLIGERFKGFDPFAVTELHTMMCRFVSYWGRTGFCKNVISAVEMALWDLKGKALGVPVYQLLGGARTASLELYASGGIDKANDDLASELAGYVTAGFRAVKIRARRFQVEKVEISRRAIGSEVALIVDAAQSFQAQPYRFYEALRFADLLADFNVAFFEEPLGVDDMEGHRKLAQRSPVPISGGETVTSAMELKRLLDQGLFQIAQPDAAVIGGISECLDVLRHCDYLGLTGVCHAWASAPCQAANVHAAFAAGSRVIEWAMPFNPLREALLSEPWQVRDGRLLLPTAPGLGIRLTAETLKEFTYVPGSANPGRVRPTD